MFPVIYLKSSLVPYDYIIDQLLQTLVYPPTPPAEWFKCMGEEFLGRAKQLQLLHFSQ